MSLIFLHGFLFFADAFVQSLLQFMFLLHLQLLLKLQLLLEVFSIFPFPFHYVTHWNGNVSLNPPSEWT